MCILRVLPENTPEKIGQERAGTEWTLVKSKIRLRIRNRSCGRFLHGGILMVVELIEKIEVYEGNRVEITFRFHDEIADLLEELHQKQMEQHEVPA